MLGTHVHNENAISHKVEKEGKPHGKNPPAKREMKRDAWMDVIIKTPSLQYTYSIYNSEEWEEQDLIRVKSPPHKKEEEERQGNPLPQMKNAN